MRFLTADSLGILETSLNPEHKLLKALLTSPSERWVKNSSVHFEAIELDRAVLPIAVSLAKEDSSYVCSPYTHYITYGKEELEKAKNRWLRSCGTGFLNILRHFLPPEEIDKNVWVNNWLVSTNLYPPLEIEEIHTLTDALTEKYPDYAILFRSVNRIHPQGLFDHLQRAGYEFLMSREIYITDFETDRPFQSRMFKSDQKILRNTDYRMIDDPKVLLRHIPRIQQLYNALNIEKYSHCNPQYSQEWIGLAIEAEWIKFKAFEKEGRIDAVFGAFANEAMETSPFFGYDTQQPEELGLYRLLATQLLQDAEPTGKLLHQSSGAGHYKKLRRARGYPEYTALFTKHLSLARRLQWKALQGIMNTFGERFARKKD